MYKSLRISFFPSFFYHLHSLSFFLSILLPPSLFRSISLTLSPFLSLIPLLLPLDLSLLSLFHLVLPHVSRHLLPDGWLWVDAPLLQLRVVVEYLRQRQLPDGAALATPPASAPPSSQLGQQGRGVGVSAAAPQGPEAGHLWRGQQVDPLRVLVEGACRGACGVGVIGRHNQYY